MAYKQIPTPETLRQLLRYEPETGRFFWRERGPEWFSSKRYSSRALSEKWNRQYAGAEALVTKKDGYMTGEVLGVFVFAHRVAWCLQNGEWPSDCIDHINGNRSDNRIKNLRQANRSQNARNRGASKGGTSQFCGVSLARRYKSKPWNAAIRAGGKLIYIGRFATEKDAALAYDMEAKKLHGDFARLNFPDGAS